MRVVVVSTPVARLGDPLAGGVTAMLDAAVEGLARRGHDVEVVAPRGSVRPSMAAALVECDGDLHAPAQERPAHQPTTERSVLTRMLEVAAKRVADAVVSVAYDLPALHAVRESDRPAGQAVTMSSVGDAVFDAAVRELAGTRPGAVATMTAAQAATFGLPPDSSTALGAGLDLDAMPFGRQAERRVAWAGRIAPEKRAGDAVAAAALLGMPIDVCGAIADAEGWAAALAGSPDADVVHHRQLDRAALASVLARACALLVTPGWEEAMGLVAVEAMACGTPVVAYARGGLVEIVDEHTGVLVPPGDIEALAAGVHLVSRLDRGGVRRRAAERFGLGAYGERWERWIAGLRGDVRHP